MSAMDHDESTPCPRTVSTPSRSTEPESFRKKPYDPVVANGSQHSTVSVSASDAKEPTREKSYSSSGTNNREAGKWYAAGRGRLKKWSKYFSNVVETIVPQELTATAKVRKHILFGGDQKFSSSIFEGGLIANVTTPADEEFSELTSSTPHLEGSQSNSISSVHSPTHLFAIQVCLVHDIVGHSSTSKY